MGSRNPLSVVIIAHNEERNLGRCLRSVQWAEEILLIDSGSTDGTVAVAESCGAQVIQQAWLGYAEQKNLGVSRATHDWVLSLDADEWLTAEGAVELQEVLKDPRAAAYAVSRRVAFSGGFLRRVWQPDWQIRIFRAESGRFAGGRVHESVRLREGCTVERLSCQILHLPYRSIRDYLERMNIYTDLAANTLQEQGQRSSLWGLLVSPMATFVKMYLLKRGFMDGVRGLVICAGSAYYVLLKFAKLWELDRAIEADYRRLTGEEEDSP